MLLHLSITAAPPAAAQQQQQQQQPALVGQPQPWLHAELQAGRPEPTFGLAAPGEHAAVAPMKAQQAQLAEDVRGLQDLQALDHDDIRLLDPEYSSMEGLLPDNSLQFGAGDGLAALEAGEWQALAVAEAASSFPPPARLSGVQQFQVPTAAEAASGFPPSANPAGVQQFQDAGGFD